MQALKLSYKITVFLKLDFYVMILYLLNYEVSQLNKNASRQLGS